MAQSNTLNKVSVVMTELLQLLSEYKFGEAAEQSCGWTVQL